MAVSGSTNFEPDITEFIEEAYERCGLELRTGYDLKSAIRSANFMLAEWANRGLNQWTITTGTQTVTKGTNSYDLGTDVIDVLDVVVRRTVNGTTTLNNTANITKVANFSDNINVDGLSLFRANTTFLTPMTANTVSATLVEAANFNSTSDNRLKENIETIDQPNDVVSKLRGVSFNWKSDGTPAYGVIAQELQEIVPDLVSENDNGDLTVQYMGLIAFLIESNKELLQRVEQLESK